MASPDYILGVNNAELERLRFQHSVWGKVTNAFFDRIGMKKGWKCLDAGAGPGFVAFDMLERLGAGGSVALLDQSSVFLNWFEQNARDKGIANYSLIHGSVESAPLPENHYDFIFSRWVIDFVAAPEVFLAKLIAALKPGGIIALQDYYYEGLSLFPSGGACDGLADAARAYYRVGGGDPYTMGSIPIWFNKYGVEMIDYTPNSFAGNNTSNIIEWAHRFFVPHLPLMAEKGILSHTAADAMVADWLAHRSNPDTLFFSPIVVDAAGRKG